MNFFTKKKSRISFSYKDYKKKGKFLIEKNFKKITLKNIIYFVPFLFSFVESISFNYKKKKFLFLFEKNFSILASRPKFEEKIFWETFHFFKLKDSFFVEKNRNIKKYSVYNDYFLIEVKKTNFFSSVGLIKKKNSNLKKKNCAPCENSKFLLRSKKLLRFSEFKQKTLSKDFLNFFTFEKLIYEIDILPVKINEIDIVLEKNNQFGAFGSCASCASPLAHEAPKKKKEKISTRISKRNTFLLSPSNTKKIFFLKNNDFKLKGTKENFFFRNISFTETRSPAQRRSTESTTTFFSEKEKLQQKLHSFFYKTEFFYFEPSAAHEQNFSLIQPKFFTFPSNEIITLLDIFFKKKQISFLVPRFISGYEYVDYKKNEKLFLFQNTLLKKKHYKIIFPFDFLYIFHQKFFLFAEKFYFLNFNKLKTNFFASCASPLAHEAHAGFSLNFLEEGEITNFNLENKKKTIFFQKTKKTIFTEDTEDTEDEEINDFFAKNFSFLLETKKKQKIIFIEQEKIILQKTIVFNFLLKQIRNQKVFLEVQPSSQKLFEKNFKLNKYYFARRSNFPIFRKKKPPLVQNWESFSSSSWLLITQFIVSFFLITILKDVYQDYGKELLQFFLEFGNSTEIDLEEVKEQYLIENRKYKIIKKTKKKLKDIIGIDSLLPETGEILSLLKNYGRSAKYKKTIPKGILLAGPPGTGKTLLVQAISGETKVPVIVQSANLLIDPKDKGRSSKKLKNLFEKARSYSPCILFIDEIDSLGGKREKFFQLETNSDKVIESLYKKKTSEKNFAKFHFFNKKMISNESKNKIPFFMDSSHQLPDEKTKLNLLTQFLIEMDGLKNRKGVFVFGATNRLEILDPALVRPGRFDKIITFSAPSKKKRIQILKFYSKKIKIEKKISWNYLANRMIHCSAADIAAIINESAIQSIIKNTIHTGETIEKGINYISSYTIFKNKKTFLLQNKSYFQAGKALSYSLFSEKEKGIYLNVWDQKKNTRQKENFDSSIFCPWAHDAQQTKKNLENVLLTSHFGKVGELLFLFGKKNGKPNYFESDYGHEERLLISFLINFLIENWFFYSTQIFLRKENQTVYNFSMLEKIEYNIVLSKLFENDIELEKKKEISNIQNFQQQNFSPWWKQEISNRISENETLFADWYRLFLPDPEESSVNLEWIPPDLLLHNNKIVTKLGTNSTINFNNLYKIQRDFIFQSLILTAFEIAFSKVEPLRQFLDFFADQLLCYGILRDIEIEKIWRLWRARQGSPRASIAPIAPKAERTARLKKRQGRQIY